MNNRHLANRRECIAHHYTESWKDNPMRKNSLRSASAPDYTDSSYIEIPTGNLNQMSSHR
jgi:hypothetical protein